MLFVVCPQNKMYSWGSFQPLKLLSHIVDLVGNHLNSFIFTLFLTYVLCDLFHHLLPKYYLILLREEENASNQRQKKRDAEEADKVEVAPGVTVASLRRFRTALIGPTQGFPKRRRLCR